MKSIKIHEILSGTKVIRYPYIEDKIYFKRKKKIIAVNWKLFKKKFRVQDTIALRKSDFKWIKKEMDRFTHFNIQYTDHVSGKKYIILKIDEPGYFDGQMFRPAIFDSKNLILAKCLSVKNYLNYKNINNSIFKNSLENIKDISSLKKAIKRRYKRSLKHISYSEKLSLGVAVTELKIIKRLSKI